MDLSSRFPEGFVWGTATASYQVEGAVNEDGRGVSIWDTFSRTPGKVVHGHTGDIACDQYHRYPEDIDLMRELGTDAYRFSIAWPRVFPQGRGTMNPAGFDYYNRLVDALLEAGIQPVPTLYHWDLPQTLEDAGGWPERDTAYAFEEYAHACFDALGDRVRMWITLNEPLCSSILGYLQGIHAPGIQDMGKAISAIHHLNLAHGLALKAFREGNFRGRIGTTLNTQTPRPATRREEDVQAADRAADLKTRMFLDPVLGKGYPQRFLEAYPDAHVPVKDGDLEIIAGDIDFLGVNYYTESAVAHDPTHPEGFREVSQYQEKTDMGWPITPDGLYRHLNWLHAHTGGLPMYVTENGCAMPDHLNEDGTRVHDKDRIDFLRAYFRACADAIRDGVNLQGYFLWSFIDNFEWAYGYTKRFGLVYCDYTDRRRIPKDSYYFYRDVIAGME
ncbi:MAG: GH1 family beta-glucosidase [Spirochaetota bacterium]